ncbi:MAG: tetratricopeptide repeat protein [Saprospirales bacterium]|nr:tetratricopeptide repeat protein [Saprospirales bacterium]
MSIAASLLLAVTATWWWQNTQKIATIEQLASMYLVQSDPGIDLLDPEFSRDGDASTSPLITGVAPEWDKLRAFYAAGDYRAAMEQLQLLKGADPTFSLFSESEWTYYAGMCQLHLGETQKALATLEQVDAPFLEKATFFQAIALIKLDRKEEAKSVLNSITSQDAHSFKEPAIELSKALD